MIRFLDTSVIVASSDEFHVHHQRSLPLVLESSQSDTFCSTHTIAEFYAVLTRLPGFNRQSTETTCLFLEALRNRVTFVALPADEYMKTVQGLASRRIAGAQVYDALLLACARKVEAERIFTWNLAHFRAIAPDLADRIVEP